MTPDAEVPPPAHYTDETFGAHEVLKESRLTCPRELDSGGLEFPTWRASGAAGPVCDSCGCDRYPDEPEDEGLAFDFCPVCWSMRGEDRARGESFNVRRYLSHRCPYDRPRVARGSG